MTRISRHARTALLLGIVPVVLLGAVTSPLVLAAVGDSADLDWVLLGNIGHAYGGRQLPCCLLLLSPPPPHQSGTKPAPSDTNVLRWPGRTNARSFACSWTILRPTRPHTHTHTPYIASLSPTNVRRYVYTQLMINYLEAGYASGFFHDSDLRGSDGMRLIFNTSYGRRYWQQTRHGYLQAGDRTSRRFAEIVDDEYRKAVATGPPAVWMTNLPIHRRLIPPMSGCRLLGAPESV